MTGNIRSSDIKNCFPLLAAVLGNKYGVQVRIGGDEAKTNGNVIYLPSIPSDMDKDAIQIAKGYLDHEAAHVRHTDFEAIKSARLDKLTKYLFNCIEDWRVENRLSEIFPGCRYNFNTLVHKLFVEDEKEKAGNKTPAFSLLRYVLLSVRAWDVPEIGAERDSIAAQIESSYPGLPAIINEILNRTRRDCPDTQKALDYARELEGAMRQYLDEKSRNEEQKEKDAEQTSNPSGDKRHEDKQASSKSGQDSHPDDVNKEVETNETADADHTEPTVSQTPESEESQQPDPAESAIQELGQALTGEMSELPQTLGELLATKLENNPAGSNDNGIRVATSEKMEVKRLTPEEISEAKRSSNALNQRLSGLLQARSLASCGIGRKGKLNSGYLHRLSVADPRVFQSIQIAQSLDTAVHILLDRSGSMTGNPIKLASLACYAVARSLEMIKGVNVAVTAFPGDKSFISVCPLVRYGDRVTDKMSPGASGGTPMAEALWWMLQDFCLQKESRKIALLITDGVPDREQPCLAAINEFHRQNIEVYGIGIQTSSIENLLSGKCVTIRHLGKLAPAMFGILQRALLA